MLEVELDHATGDMRGQVLAGPYAGRPLDGIDVPDLVALRAACDAQSLALLEAYLDTAGRPHGANTLQAHAGGVGGAAGEAWRETWPATAR